MSKQVALDSSVLSGLVQYMKCSDALLGKQASLDDAIGAEASAIVDALIKASLVPSNLKSASVARLKEDPVYVVELLSKAAAAIRPEAPIGGPSDAVKSANVSLTADDAFVMELMK